MAPSKTYIKTDDFGRLIDPTYGPIADIVYTSELRYILLFFVPDVTKGITLFNYSCSVLLSGLIHTLITDILPFDHLEFIYTC